MVKREPCKTHLDHSGHVHSNTGIFETAYFYPDSCGRDPKPLRREVSKRHGFGERIQRFRVNHLIG